jgi:hypothetical protein
MAGLIATLGILGLPLAAVGMYGLLSFLVGRRTHEIGIRLLNASELRQVWAPICLVLGCPRLVFHSCQSIKAQQSERGGEL